MLRRIMKSVLVASRSIVRILKIVELIKSRFGEIDFENCRIIVTSDNFYLQDKRLMFMKLDILLQ